MVGPEHDLVKEYSNCQKFIEDHKLEFQQALIDNCGVHQAPAVQSFLFHRLCLSFFLEQPRGKTPVKPHSLREDLYKWRMG